MDAKHAALLDVVAAARALWRNSELRHDGFWCSTECMKLLVAGLHDLDALDTPPAAQDDTQKVYLPDQAHGWD